MADEHGNTSWTSAQIDELRLRLARGESASVIAAVMGRTRNAIIGKSHRLKAKRGPPQRQRRRRRQSNHPIIIEESAAMSAEPVELPPPLPVNGRGKRIMALKPNDCRWPLGEATGWHQEFCAQPKLAAFPYCAGHCRMAYQAPRRYP